MSEFEIILKIVDLLISTVGIILIIVGLVLPFKQSVALNKISQKGQLEQAKRAWRMQLLDEQISKYYGPISAILKEQTIVSKRVWYQIGRFRIFNHGKGIEKLSDLEPDEQLIWKHFIDYYTIPMQRQILDIMRDNAHLAIHGEHDVYVNAFLDYVIGWELLDNQRRQGVPNYYEYQYSNNYPAQFDTYINGTLRELCSERERLIGEAKE